MCTLNEELVRLFSMNRMLILFRQSTLGVKVQLQTYIKQDFIDLFIFEKCGFGYADY